MDNTVKKLNYELLMADVIGDSAKADIPHHVIDDALTKLRDNEVEVISLRYANADKMTFKKIGEKFDIPRERVRQILAKGKRRLRNLLKDYF